MKAALLLLAALALPAAALEAPSVVGLHVATAHQSGHGEPPQGWNNVNPGVYLRWDSGLTVGAFRNSEYRNSAYAGWTVGDTFALTAGVITGYARGTQPLLVPSVRLGPARFSLLAPPHGALALHLSVERRF